MVLGNIYRHKRYGYSRNRAQTLCVTFSTRPSSEVFPLESYHLEHVKIGVYV